MNFGIPSDLGKRRPAVSLGSPIEAYGNDELLEDWERLIRRKLRGIRPAEIATFKPTAQLY
jgi:hypothetical protein